MVSQYDRASYEENQTPFFDGDDGFNDSDVSDDGYPKPTVHCAICGGPIFEPSGPPSSEIFGPVYASHYPEINVWSEAYRELET